MGKLKAILLLTLSFAVALGASYLVYQALERKTVIPQVQVEETLPVAVTVAGLPWGTKLGPEMIQLSPYLKQSLPAGHFSSKEALTGRVVITPMNANEPILESKLAPISVATGGMWAIVKPGKRALAIKGDKVIGLSGLIHPGNRVDVLVTIVAPEGSESSGDVTKVVLEDIPVLATGSVLETPSDGTKPTPEDVYTLEVTPEDAEKLALAGARGRVQLALRSATDADVVLTRGAGVREMLSSYQSHLKPPQPPEPPVVTPSKPAGIQVIKGTTVATVDF